MIPRAEAHCVQRKAAQTRTRKIAARSATFNWVTVLEKKRRFQITNDQLLSPY